jgi:hypothetical protein
VDWRWRGDGDVGELASKAVRAAPSGGAAARAAGQRDGGGGRSGCWAAQRGRAAPSGGAAAWAASTTTTTTSLQGRRWLCGRADEGRRRTTGEGRRRRTTGASSLPSTFTLDARSGWGREKRMEPQPVDAPKTSPKCRSSFSQTVRER